MVGDRPMIRRTFLLDLGRGLSAVMMMSLLEACERSRLTPLTTGTDVPFLTPSGDLFVQNGAQGAISGWTMPVIDAAQYRFRVDGLVNAARTFSVEELRALAAQTEEVTFLKTLQCVFEAPLLSSATGLTGNAYWTGIPLRHVIDACGGPTAEAKRYRFLGVDGFRNNIKVSRLAESGAEVLPPTLVYSMNGAPLTREHGAPLRLILPEGFGFKNVKWIASIEATALDTAWGTYQDNGFTDDGVLAVTSRTTRPLANTGLRAGAVEVSGVALSGAAGISAVEMRVDGGAWEPVEILGPGADRMKDLLPWNDMEQVKQAMPYPYRGVWTLWRTSWIATPGSHALSIRAIDRSGAVQPEMDRDLSDGTNAIAVIEVLVS